MARYLPRIEVPASAAQTRLHCRAQPSILKRSAILSIYAAILPAAAHAKCGNVDYSWGADALASAHDFTVTMMLYVVYLCYAIAGIVVIVSALQIYIKMNSGEDGITKNIMMLIGACIFLISATIALPAFFGYRI